MENIKAIIFDFDNTLADRTKATYLAFCFMLDEFAPELEKGSIYREAVLQDMMAWDMFGNYRKSFIAENLEEKYGIKLPIALGEWWSVNQYKFEDLFPDTIETLLYLKQKGYKLGVLTNGSSISQKAKLDKNHVSDYVDEVVICGDYDFQKPDQKAFDYICHALDVKNEEAIYVGDIYSNDMLGATNARMECIWMWPDGRRFHSSNVVQISKISDLKRIF